MSFEILFNFALFVFVISWVVGPKLKPLAATRFEKVRAELESARAVLAAAQQRELRAAKSVVALEQEKKQVAQEYAALATKKSLEIATEASRVASQLAQDVVPRKARLLDELRSEVKKEVAEAVLLKAENLIKGRLSGEEKIRVGQELAKDFEVSLR